MSHPIIQLQEAIARDPARRLQAPVNFTLEQGEQLALIGLNGSSKSTLIEMITGTVALQEGTKTYHFIDEPADKPSTTSSQDAASSVVPRSNLASDNIRYIAFRDAYGTADGNYYYQQRWNASDREGVALTRDLLTSIHCDPTHRDRIFRLLQIEPLLDKQIILLSSGELRRFQIAKMLLTAPRVLILESPFIGLDADTRETLSALLTQLAAENTVQIILSVCSPEDIPSFITHVYTLQGKTCGPKQTRNDFMHSEPFTALRDQW